MTVYKNYPSLFVVLYPVCVDKIHTCLYNVDNNVSEVTMDYIKITIYTTNEGIAPYKIKEDFAFDKDRLSFF